MVKAYKVCLPLIIFLLILALSSLSGCVFDSRQNNVPFIDIADAQTNTTEYDQKDHEPIRLAIASIISPSESIRSYDTLIKYLEKRLDRKIEVTQRNSYSEVSDLLRTGRVDMAFVCTYPYLAGAKQFGLEPLAVPEVDGKVGYRSLIIVRKDSGINSFDQLKGKTFAFTDPMSTTGYYYPQSLLVDLNTTDCIYFSKTFFTYSHDNAIKAVVKGLADGGAVEDLVFFRLQKQGSPYIHKLKVIKESQEFYPPPVVVRPGLEVSLKQQIASELSSSP